MILLIVFIINIMYVCQKPMIMRKVIFPILMMIIVTACSNSSNSNLDQTAFQGETQGTYYLVRYYDQDGRDLQDDIESLLKDFDQSLSLWVNNSVISKLNRNEEVELDKYFIENYKLSMRIAKETRGAFDFTMGPLIEAWGFGFREKIKLTQEKVDSIKGFIGFEKVSLENSKIIKEDPRIELNFNAIAQGYSVDLIGKFLNEKGIKNFLIDVGGEIISQGSKPNNVAWLVGIQKPTEEADGAIEAQVRVELTNKAFVTSGSYRKFYEEDGKRYSHIIDPVSGYPITHSLISVTVLANTCAEADGYATAFMVMGIEKAFKFVQARNDLEVFFIYEENGAMNYSYTDGLKSLIR